MTKEITIKWESPVSQNEIKKKREVYQGSGVYQLCGYHPVYGEDDVLLYIGETDCLYCRIKNHEYINLLPNCFKPEKIKIRVGRIVKNKDNVHLKTIEGILIFMHSPAWNSAKVRNPCECYRDIEIKNEGKNGCLWDVKGNTFFN